MPEVAAPPRLKPDIRAITRLVPPTGNLVQGQSELALDPELMQAANAAIAGGFNHYCPSEGVAPLRKAIAEKIAQFNGVKVDAEAQPLEVLVTHGGTGALVAIAKTYLKDGSILLFEPYYPYHKIITESFGGKAEIMPLSFPDQTIDPDELRKTVRELKGRAQFPLKAIMICTPSNPTGKVMSRAELELLANVCQEFDLLAIADEVYEHYVVGDRRHISMATIPGMWERTITVNSFSKSWNVSGWRQGYVYGYGKIVAPLNAVTNVNYVNTATPLQHALAACINAIPGRYDRLRDKFLAKRALVAGTLTELGFEVYESGSAFYLWTKIPPQFKDAMPFNQTLIEKAKVGAVPGAAFSDRDVWDNYMRFCIAREDNILEGAMEKLRAFLK